MSDSYEHRELPGRCNEHGPYGTTCTDYPGHRYAHYDGSDDSSWTDDWREWADPPWDEGDDG